MSERLKFVIDRSKWYRGQKDAALRVSSCGQYCCLGLIALQLGFSDEDLDNLCSPGETVNAGRQKKWPSVFVDLIDDLVDDDGNEFTRAVDTSFTNVAVSHNDNEEIDDRERERRLAEHFAAKAIDLEFIDGAEPAGAVPPSA